MKNYTLRFKAVDKKNFDEVKNGLKIVETRAATVKYQPIEVGDTLVFVCGKYRLKKKITKKARFKSINAMVKKIPFKKIMPSIKSVAEMKHAYSSYSGYDEKIKKFGILAFWIK